jgi:hypothetical protein
MLQSNINSKLKIQNSKLLALLLIAVVLASSCASRRTSYHKPPKQRKCDCSRWSYITPGHLYFYSNNEKGHPGRA